MAARRPARRPSGPRRSAAGAGRARTRKPARKVARAVQRKRSTRGSGARKTAARRTGDKSTARKTAARQSGAGTSAARPASAGKASAERARRQARAGVKRPARVAPAASRGGRRGGMETAGLTRLPDALAEHHETSPILTGGDVDADWQRADSVGEEAVGGSVATPDQDVVDEIGHALGVEQESDAEVRASDDILRERDAQYWRLESDAADEAEGRRRPRR